MALQTRNVMKRLFAYAIARGKTQFNPAAAIEARFIATARSRDVALSQAEIGQLLRGIYQSSIRRPYKLALHVLILCMVRKGELIGTRWEEIDFEKAQWLIPAERMKKDKPHLVLLSKQAVAMFEELKGLAGNSPWVLPSRNTLREPIAHSTLNQAIRSLDLGIRDFVIHDFRRTASTQLHEAGFNSDWIEKALAHEQKGVSGGVTLTGARILGASSDGDLRMPLLNSPRSRWIVCSVVGRWAVDLRDIGWLMPPNEGQNPTGRRNERAREVRIGRTANDHEQRHAVFHDGRRFVRFVAYAAVVSHRDPALPADLP